MEGGSLPDSENNTIGGLIGIQMGKENQKTMPLTGSLMRRTRLSDITNTSSNGRSERSDASECQNAKVAPCTSTKDYIDQLLKENNALLRLLAERNKVIEMSGIQLQRLRFTLQKTSQQNWQLARVNSQMLAELNLGKDRLKVLQHELGCKEAVLRVKSSDLEEEKKLNKQHKQPCKKIGAEEEQKKPAEVAVDAPHQATCKKACYPTRKRALRSRSLGPTTLTHQASANEKDESRRRSLRRKSSTLKAEPCEPTEELFEIEDVKLPIRSNEDSSIGLGDSSADSVPNSILNPVREDREKNQSVSPHYQNEGSRRTSIGRPTRRAAEKVSSYKEAPLNVKMRRAP